MVQMGSPLVVLVEGEVAEVLDRLPGIEHDGTALVLGFLQYGGEGQPRLAGLAGPDVAARDLELRDPGRGGVAFPVRDVVVERLDGQLGERHQAQRDGLACGPAEAG